MASAQIIIMLEISKETKKEFFIRKKGKSQKKKGNKERNHPLGKNYENPSIFCWFQIIDYINEMGP